LLELVLENWAISSIERFINRSTRKDILIDTFPDEYAVHVHQICLTYLVGSSQFPLQLDPQLVHFVSTVAAQSPIPINVFDNLIDKVLTILYADCFPKFAKKYRLIEDVLTPTQSPIQELFYEPLANGSETGYYSFEDLDLSYDSDQGNKQKNTGGLNHATSSILDYINDTADSIYSEIDFEEESKQSMQLQNDLASFRAQTKNITHSKRASSLNMGRYSNTSTVRAKSTNSNSTQGAENPTVHIPSTQSSVNTLYPPSPTDDLPKYEADDEGDLLALYEPGMFQARRPSVVLFPQRRSSIQQELKPNWRKSIKNSMKKFFDE
jgi:hypothetical protein